MIRENYKRIQKNGTLYMIIGLSFTFIAVINMLLVVFTPINSIVFSLISKIFLLIGLLMMIYGYKMMVSERIKTEDFMNKNLLGKNFDSELKQLEKQRADGLITEKEFMYKRKELMDSEWD